MTVPHTTVAASTGDRAAKSKVAVLYTTPETVLEDTRRLMHLADYQRYLLQGMPTGLKINISWQHYYPACSTSPWQLEGVIKTLLQDGYQPLEPWQNGTVVVDSHEGEIGNKHKPVLDKYGLKSIHLNDPGTRWIHYQPRNPMLVLDRVYSGNIRIPEVLIGKNVIQLPTVKTHVFTTMTGAMKNAFGGLLGFERHWTHSVIHETLVDLLTIQKEIHPAIFAVMDGTFAGEGPGPRAMRWDQKNIILASADQVAIDAVAAKLMGLDPMSLRFIRLAHEKGLGCGNPSEIELVGDDVSDVNWHFNATQDTFASRGQKLIYWGPLKPFEKLLLRTPIVPWSYMASNLYFNHYWYRFQGRKQVQEALKTPWGQLFQQY